MDASIGVSALLPGVAATLVAMHRARHTSFMTAHPPLARAALVALTVLLFGACHSIDRDAFAQAPVPLSTLPFREPVRFTQSGDAVVGYQSGLLASYYAGAQYDRLDHQQVDPNVDFTWDATGNPVISAPDGIDHNDGDFRLPDSWGIWSVVWEGYLKVPSDGTYLLRIHVNNGGWLEMKTPSGALTTVIDCAGGTSFEGDCDATATLAAGPQYIRFSYYNNAPPGASARLLWQPPGATGVTVIPTDVLTTQATPARKRAFIYVHGTTGQFNAPDFRSLLDRLNRSYVRLNFRYYEDRRYARSPFDLTCAFDEGGGPGQRRLPDHAQIQLAYPFVIDGPDSPPGVCDSNDDIELNAVLLDADVAAQEGKFDSITLVANSGGGAIVRAYLAYATAARTGTLDKIDAVMLLEGVEHGTYLMALYNGSGAPTSDNPVVSTVRDAIIGEVRAAVGHDPTRPAARDFTPLSDLIHFYNRASSIPNHLHYVNVAGDIDVHVSAQVLFFVVPAGDIALGDGVMRPGRDDPSTEPLPAEGGARFLPSEVHRGASSTQWVLHADYDVVMGSLEAPVQIASVLLDPALHVSLARMHEICVNAPGVGGIAVTRLDDALIDVFTSFDTSPPDPSRVGLGNLQRVRCP